MSRTRRGAWVVWLTVGPFAFLNAGPVRSQEGPRDYAVSAPSASLPASPALARRLAAAHDYLKQGAWAEGTRALQTLLDTEEDTVVCVRRAGADGKAAVRWTGVWAEADRLLAGLPAHGREFYETAHGASARALLEEAARRGDPELLARTARRYAQTPAGAEATRRLALHHLDRGRFGLAAVCFERLLGRAGAERLPPATLFAASLAFEMSGNEVRAERVWETLAARAPGGLRLGGRAVGLAELTKERARLRATLPEPPAAPARLAGPLPGAAWARTTLNDETARDWVRGAAEQQEDRSQPVLPGAVPLALGDRVVYRSGRGVQAVDLRTGQPAWGWESERGFDRLAADPRHHSYLSSWVVGYLPNNPHLVFENAVVGGLSTDGARVYAVDDLPMPPYPARYAGGGRRLEGSEPSYGPDLADAVRHNRLVALDAATGRRAYSAGGPDDGFFLGPPLALDGRLYAVVEKDLELRLVCLDAARGAPLWSQELAAPMNRLLIDVGRRAQALRVSHADGILVCPTNSGAILGVDLFSRGLAWAYVYRDAAPEPEAVPGFGGRRGRSVPRELPKLREEWKAAGPVVQDGKVVVTAPDTASVHCLDLRSGAPLWKAERAEDDLYLAGVFGGRVLLVGRQGCRALALADGKPLWAVETETPSGLGAAAGGAYYLPLKAATPEQPPTVLALDLAGGKVLARMPVPRAEVLGNLVLCEDAVLSQSVTTVTAYPSRGEGRADK